MGVVPRRQCRRNSRIVHVFFCGANGVDGLSRCTGRAARLRDPQLPSEAGSLQLARPTLLVRPVAEPRLPDPQRTRGLRAVWWASRSGSYTEACLRGLIAPDE